LPSISSEVGDALGASGQRVSSPSATAALGLSSPGYGGTALQPSSPGYGNTALRPSSPGYGDPNLRPSSPGPQRTSDPGRPPAPDPGDGAATRPLTPAMVADIGRKPPFGRPGSGTVPMIDPALVPGSSAGVRAGSPGGTLPIVDSAPL